MTWSLASYTAQGTEGFGVLREDGTLAAPTELKRWSSTLELLEDWPAAQAVLRDLNPAEAPVIEYDALLPPLRWPRKVNGLGFTPRPTACPTTSRRAGSTSATSRPRTPSATTGSRPSPWRARCRSGRA